MYSFLLTTGVKYLWDLLESIKSRQKTHKQKYKYYPCEAVDPVWKYIITSISGLIRQENINLFSLKAQGCA